MRKVILNLAVSLDGFIEGPNGEYDWCLTDQDYSMSNFMKRIDTIFFGRRSYELMISLEKNPYPDKNKYVFSNTLNETKEGFRLINNNIGAEVDAIKKGKGKDIWLFGGASLTKSFLNANLIDELQLAVHPILLGCGKPLFGNINERTYLKLIDKKTYPGGLVQLFYKFDKK